MWCVIASTLGEVVVRFTADTIGLNQGIANSISRLTSFGAVVGAIGVGAIAGLIGIGVASTKMAGDFQQGINRLVTGAGDVTDNMRVMGKGILDASVATGVLTSGTDGLNAAMYQIISSGQRGAQALNTLTVAAKGSQIEQANVVDVSKALTTAMTDYGTKQYDATQFMNGYIAAVSRGRITLEELSNAMGPILPLAKNLGISFADVSAAMSTMTNAGIPASRAATSLRFLFQSLEEPTKKASNAMKQWGVDSVALGNELRVSLPGALEMIYNAAKRAGPEGSVPFNRAVADMIGGQRSLQAYLALTGTHFATFSNDAKQIAGAMNGSKSAVTGWAIAQGNFNVKMGEAHAALNAMFITIGTQLLPAMSAILDKITPTVVAFTGWVAQSGNLNKILIGLGVAMGVLATWLTVLAVRFAILQTVAAVTALIAFGTWLATAISLLPTVIGLFWLWAASLDVAAIGAALLDIALSPITLIILGIAAVIIGIILLIKNWGAVMQFLGGVCGWIGNLVGNVFSAMGTAVHASLGNIRNFVGSTFDWIGTHIRDSLTATKNFVGSVFSSIGTVVHDRLTELKNTVGQQFSNLGTLAHDGVMSVAHGVVDGFHWMYDHNIYVKQMVDANTVLFSTMSTRTQQLTTQMVTGVGQQFSNLGTLTRDSMTMIKNSVGDAFNVMGTVARDRSTELKNTVGQQFSNLGTLVHDAMTTMKNFVGDQFSTMGTIASQQSTTLKNNVGQAFSNLGTAVHGAVVFMWNDVTSQFAGAWGRISPVLSGLWNNISSWFTGLANRAFSWGANVLGQFVSGFQSMMGNLGNAIGNAAGAVANFLGFHSPAKEGPGSDADKWAPNLMRMLAEGIRLGTPQLQLALNASLKPPGFAASTLLSPTSSAGTPRTIVLEVDGRALGHAIATNMASEIRLKMGVF